MAAQLLGETACTAETPDARPVRAAQVARMILTHAESRSVAWLHDQAVVRGYAEPEPLPVPGAPEGSFGRWVDEQMRGVNASLRALSKAADISPAYVSQVRCGRVGTPSRRMVVRLATALAREQGLGGEATDRYVSRALSMADYTV